MFGCFSNIRLSEQERKILKDEPDDAIWYSMVLGNLFKDNRRFQIREDIEVPKKEDDDGVLLMMEDGSIVYFRTSDGVFDNGEYNYMIGVCSWIVNKFHRPLNVYMACDSRPQMSFDSKNEGVVAKIVLSRFITGDNEKIIDRLVHKLENNEEFDYGDSVDHMLLPFGGYKNKSVFDKKYAHYMDLINSCGV